MKRIFTFFFLLIAVYCRAQNYECFKPDSIQYFTNSAHYLRGIRIDSVRSSKNTTVYYPFHTMRGGYSTGLGTGLNSYDSSAGSWVGKTVIQLQDGTWLFDNMWGDTVVIRTQAQMGESWRFYDGVFNLYYTATVTDYSTMTILGTSDSVKTITITAHNTTTGVAEPANNTQIILSKNHGFVQAIDLYTFPYHKPDSAYSNHLDYFIEKVGNNVTFNPVIFVNPKMSELYSWNIGDAFEYSNTFASRNYDFDSVIAKTVKSTGITYVISSWGVTLGNGSGIPGPRSLRIDTIQYNNNPLFTVNVVPEQAALSSIYYAPDDSSFCMTSASYTIHDDWGYGMSYSYKIGLGQLQYERYDPETRIDAYMIYSRKGGVSCGDFYNVGVNDTKSVKENLAIYPNPAGDELIITSGATAFSTAIIDMTGRVVYSATNNNEVLKVNTSNLPAGIYNVRIMDGDNSSLNRKIVIVH